MTQVSTPQPTQMSIVANGLQQQKCDLWQQQKIPRKFIFYFLKMPPPLRKLALLPSHDDREPRGVYLSSFRTP